MRIAELPFKDGRAGSNNAWRSTTEDGDGFRRIYHYGHLMMTIEIDHTGCPAYLDRYPVESIIHQMNTGWGSVSDQGGMNQMFRALNVRYYFVRRGGPRIE